VPEKGLGIALKIVDGNGRAKEAAIAALLTRVGVLDAAHPVALRYTAPVLRNWRNLETGFRKMAPGFPG